MFRKILFLIITVTLIACSARSPIALKPRSAPLSQPVSFAQPATPQEAASLPAIETQLDLYGQTDTCTHRGFAVRCVSAPLGEPPEVQGGSPPPNLYGQTYVSAPTTRLPILEYHYSTFKMGAGVRMETDWFLNQLQWLHDNNFQTLTAAQLAAFVHGKFNPPTRSVVLTFDVGASKFDDYVNVVIPALRQYNFHAIFFILASRTEESCDQSGEHIGSPLPLGVGSPPPNLYGQTDVSAPLGVSSPPPDTTCWPLLKHWADEGLISVGSHSWSHIDYQTLTPEQIYLDAAHSKALIEAKTGHSVLGLCYPFDSVNPAAFDLLDSLGYQFAVGGYTQADRSAHVNADQPFALPRYYPYSGDYYPIIGGTHGQTFDKMLLGAIDQ